MKYGLLLTALFIAATALTSGEYTSAYMAAGSTTVAPTPTPTPNTTTHSPNTTIHNPNTTTLSPNTTIHNPNTTTHSPNTTIHNPNTTTLSPNTTTHNPNTTTTPSPNTTVTTASPSPTPPTKMAVGHYNFTRDGKLCIMVEMAIVIRVNNTKANGTFIVQPNQTSVDGQCGEKASTISIKFNEGEFTLKFINNEKIKKVYVEYVGYDLHYAFKTGESNTYTGNNDSLELFSVDPGHSYSCQAETVYMGAGVSLDLTHNKFQAFDFKNNQFGPPELCKADQPDYRVPIAVGIILIILIIIVVIAYLISRKRRTNAYQSL